MNAGPAPKGSSAALRPSWPQHLTAVAAAGAVAAGVGVGAVHLRRRALASPSRPLRLPRPLMEAVFGAIGEISQVAMLYPLDTLKVRCQASGASATSVLRAMLAAHPPLAVLGQLYAGVIASSICSIAIGSLYYLTFCTAKRVAGDVATAWSASHAAPPRGVRSKQVGGQVAQAAAGGPQPASAATSASSSDGSLAVNITAAVAAALVGALIEAPVELFKNQTKVGLLQGDMLRHMGSTLRTFGLSSWYWGFLPFCIKSLPFDVGELLTWAQLRDWHHHLRIKHGHMATPVAAAAAPGTASGQLCAPTGSAAEPHLQVFTSCDGTVFCLPSSLLPAECLPPALPSTSDATVSSTPPTDLSVPDKWRWSAEHWLVTQLPNQVWDAAIGAAAGAAAVLVSMPGDCIKTHMDTRVVVNTVPAAGSGGWRSVMTFFTTGSLLVARHGPGALYTGMWPRLCGMVPSTALYWIAVEGCRRMAEPYMADAVPALESAVVPLNQQQQ